MGLNSSQVAIFKQPVADFLAECVDAADPTWREPEADVYRAYSRWAERRGQRACSPLLFGRVLTERGIVRVKSSRIFFAGIRLRGRGNEAQHAGISTA